MRAYSAQGYLFLGELLVDAGQRDAALDNLKRAVAMYREMGVGPRYWLAPTQAALARLTS